MFGEIPRKKKSKSVQISMKIVGCSFFGQAILVFSGVLFKRVRGGKKKLLKNDVFLQKFEQKYENV